MSNKTTEIKRARKIGPKKYEVFMFVRKKNKLSFSALQINFMLQVNIYEIKIQRGTFINRIRMSCHSIIKYMYRASYHLKQFPSIS